MEIIVQLMVVTTQLDVPQRLSTAMTVMNVHPKIVIPSAVVSTMTLIATIKTHALLIVAIIQQVANMYHFRAMMAMIVPSILVMTLPDATTPM